MLYKIMVSMLCVLNITLYAADSTSAAYFFVQKIGSEVIRHHIQKTSTPPVLKQLRLAPSNMPITNQRIIEQIVSIPPAGRIAYAQKQALSEAEDKLAIYRRRLPVTVIKQYNGQCLQVSGTFCWADFMDEATEQWGLAVDDKLEEESDELRCVVM